MVFVGRERELARLAGALQRAGAGRPSRVVLTATAGMGVTCLLDELTRRVAPLPEVVVVRGTAAEPAAGEPYQALVEGLEATLSSLSDAGLRRVIVQPVHDLAVLMPGLAARLDTLGIDRSPPRLVAPDQAGSRVMESLIGLVERLAATGVLLLILEDLHRADPATRAFVAAMLRVHRPQSVCLVLSYRPEELSRQHPFRPLAAALEADATAERIKMAPLDADELERLVTAIDGSRPAGDLMAAIHVGSAGSPLMVRHLLSATRAATGVRLSDSFEDGVGALLDNLSPPARLVVRLLAAARQPLPRAVVAGIRMGGARLTTIAIEEAIASGLVIVIDDRLSIVHELHAEAVEAVELPGERVRLHATLASVFEERPSRAAWHWAAAGRTREAFTAHRAAAAIARASDPGETALHHDLRALESWATLEASGDGNAHAEDTTDLLVDTARSAAAAGAFRRSAAFLRRAIAARDAEGQTGHRDARRTATGALQEELGRVLWASGDLAGGIAAMEHARIDPAARAKSAPRARPRIARAAPDAGRPVPGERDAGHRGT